jgi:hypothetical protein
LLWEKDRMLRISGFIFALVGGVAYAQTPGSVNLNPTPSQLVDQDEVPLGGCMPIGLTASGNVVFPIACKTFLELQRGKDANSDPTAATLKPAVDQVPAVSEPALADPKMKPERDLIGDADPTIGGGGGGRLNAAIGPKQSREFALRRGHTANMPARPAHPLKQAESVPPAQGHLNDVFHRWLGAP